MPETVSANVAPTPDNPPWNGWIAIGVWVMSILFIFIFPTIFVFPYLISQKIDLADRARLIEVMTTDKTAILLQLLSVFPAHIFTLLFAWVIVTNLKKYPFRQMLGWDWGGFKIWHAFAVTVAFFGLGIGFKFVFPEQENEMDKIVKSSTAATYLVALFATFTAPLVEEVVYRGILYSGLLKSFRTPLGVLLSKFRLFRLVKLILVKLQLLDLIEKFHTKYAVQLAVVFVTVLFAAIHIPQYSSNNVPDYGTITLLLLLSLVLTLIRVKTKNLLPCIVLHTVFNGIQSVLLVAQSFVPGAGETAPPTVPETAAFIIHHLKIF
ncbi:MAG TPA: CPBP family intramembrane glutamic endopeptidase [Pyrinomonadaceae bacterium]